MLYTVRPLERIYAPPDAFHERNNNKLKEDDTTQAEFKEVLLPNGRLVTRRQGEDYIIERVNSTDMKDYLNEDYVPGRGYKNTH